MTSQRKDKIELRTRILLKRSLSNRKVVQVMNINRKIKSTVLKYWNWIIPIPNYG